MSYAKPTSSLSQIDRAGRRIVAGNGTDDDLIMLWEWRAAHSYPLNALHTTLRNRTLKIDSNAITVQRLKRYESIVSKLERRPTMNLSQMQDVGGCRAIVTDHIKLRSLYDIYKSSPLRHELKNEDDYITVPKDDGYRGRHLMYRFRGSGSSLPWDKLRVEIQLRTQLQHAWATAVETVDSFTGQGLKAGGGSIGWRRFFALMGSVHALAEQAPLVPQTPADPTLLRDEIRDLENELGVRHLLQSFASLVRYFAQRQSSGWAWFVLQLKPDEKQALVEPFATKQLRTAHGRVASLESQFKDTRNQVVLVAAESLLELQRAYPNYFADTSQFVAGLNKFMEEK